MAIATLSMFIMAVMTSLSSLGLSPGCKARWTIWWINRTAPVVSSVRHLLNENSPKIARIVTASEETAANAREISVVAKDQAYRFAEVGRDITDRAKVQVARVDAAVDDTVDQVQHLGVNVRSAVMKPVSEVAGACWPGSAPVFPPLPTDIVQTRHVSHAGRRDVYLMAKLALVYGLRLLPADELESYTDGAVRLRNGQDTSVTMHVIEGRNEREIRAQLMHSLDAFFEFYPEL